MVTLVLLSSTINGSDWEAARDAAAAWELMGAQVLIQGRRYSTCARGRLCPGHGSRPTTGA